MREGHQPTYDIKRKNEKTPEIAQKTAREEYTLDWSQSKVFLVFLMIRLHRLAWLAC